MAVPKTHSGLLPLPEGVFGVEPTRSLIEMDYPG